MVVCFRLVNAVGVECGVYEEGSGDLEAKGWTTLVVVAMSPTWEERHDAVVCLV